MKKALGLAILMLFIMTGIMTTALGNEISENDEFMYSRDHPRGWTHRPIVELFTSLSCVYCMRDADPAMARLWEEEGNTDEQPFSYVSFHQTNGGQHDDPFVTDESKGRYNDYAILGTPDAQFDGGYIHESGGGDSRYEDYKSDIEDSGNRDVKRVDISVEQYFTGTSFTLNITIYMRPINEQPISLYPNLRGSLYVFMVEDNIDAYSSNLNERIISHNVFREFALEDERFEISPDETYQKILSWKVPDTIVKDNQEIPILVPINPANISAVAAVYDRDDTTSSGGGDTPSSNTPRMIQSATSRATTFDIDEDKPKIKDINAEYKGGDVIISAYFLDGSKMAGAFVVYTDNLGENATWYSKEFFLYGECEDEDTCNVYESGLGTVEVEYDKEKPMKFIILAFDGNYSYATTNATVYYPTEKSSNDDDEDGISMLAVGGIVIILVVVLVGLFIMNSRKDDNVDNVEPTESYMDEESVEYYPETDFDHYIEEIDEEPIIHPED